MFDLGMQELIVIFVVALLVLGPKKLPELGRTLGRGIGELKRAMHGMKEQIDSEITDIQEPVKKEDFHLNDDILEEEKKVPETNRGKELKEKKED